GLRSGVRSDSLTVPPASTKRLRNVFSDSAPGAKSVTIVTTLRILLFAAQSAIGAVVCGMVNPERTMNGERCGMTEVPAHMTTIATFASVATGAVANASGV